jgi:GDP-D-mannose 3',5'-epimerase
MSTKELTVVSGAGGFIGGHLVKALLAKGQSVRAVDLKPLSEWMQVHEKAQNLQLDLKDLPACLTAVSGAAYVYNLAADMGGMGYIENNKAQCMLSVLINTNMLRAAKEVGVKRYFFSSSACVYNADKQTSTHSVALTESDAYPAMPEDGYGWEKLFSERMCRHFNEDFGVEVRIARFHNVYGPQGTYKGGREKAPAAICRKVIEAVLSGNLQIEIWGDGKQTRTFMYIDDCIKGTIAIMESDITEPINLGSTQLITINELVSMVEAIAGVKLQRYYNPSAPTGVRGRSSDNSALHSALGWEPTIMLEYGLIKTYEWMYEQMAPVTTISQKVKNVYA